MHGVCWVQQKKTILIIDDVAANVHTLMALLGEEYDLLGSLDGEEALAILEEETVDLILLDILMPGMDGLEVCRRIKADEKTRDIPVIFITVKTDEDSIVAAYDLGGADYITKPFLAREVLSRVKKELKFQEMMQELALLASTDPMTRLYNRRYFSRIARHALALAKREKESLSVIMLDIDHFKYINDTYGHQVGDQVIILLAETITEQLRQSDFAARFGGEEFVILLPSTSLASARGIAEKLRKTVETLTYKSAEGIAIHFTISLGVSTVDILTEDSVEPALKRADDAMYLAKESGRNRVC